MWAFDARGNENVWPTRGAGCPAPTSVRRAVSGRDRSPSPSRPPLLRGPGLCPPCAHRREPAAIPAGGTEEGRIRPCLPSRGYLPSAQSIKDALDRLPDGRAPSRRDWERFSRRGAAISTSGSSACSPSGSTGCIGCGCLSLGLCKLVNPDDLLGQQGPWRAICERQLWS